MEEEGEVVRRVGKVGMDLISRNGLEKLKNTQNALGDVEYNELIFVVFF